VPTWFYGIGSRLTRLFLVPFGPLRVEGLERVPRSGAFILAANHVSNLDPLIVGSTVGHMTGRVVHFMAKGEVRRWPLIGWLASQAGVFFVRRGEGDRAAQRFALQLLAAGEPVAIFPEGTRSRDAALGEAKNGATLLAMRAGVPILPVGVSGAERLFPRNAAFPRRTRITVRVGEPFALPGQPAGRLDRDDLTAGTERVMREIAALLPPAQRGRWGSDQDASGS
jgi:1-acyl-sn-glycerol-3-phosphate acyltransferase